MPRALCIMLLFAGVIAASFVNANPLHRELAHVLRLDEVAVILSDEGAAYGEEIDASMLNGKGGRYFSDQVSTLYDKDRIRSDLIAVLTGNLKPTEIEQVIAFFETGTGQRILSLENAARIAMADQAVEDTARETYASLHGGNDAHLAEVERFIRVNDLLNRNVNSALVANLQFYRGLAAGEAILMSEQEMIAQVWAGETELREDTEDWLFGFLLMAYRPLELHELKSYADFSETPSGQALNTALFLGFDQIYNTISFELGIVVARAMKGQDI